MFINGNSKLNLEQKADYKLITFLMSAFIVLISLFLGGAYLISA